MDPSMNDMNTSAKRLFNALAFANVSNLGEFHTLLRQIEEPDTSVRGTTQPDAITHPSASAQVIGYIQGAL
jgi:hypothetical protein